MSFYQVKQILTNMNKLKLWLRRKVLHPWILKNKPECSVVLRDAIVYQMWAA